ncbi:MAG: hypothetical protein ACAI44_06155 [Candidatus Sericytochromatia bacterium]
MLTERQVAEAIGQLCEGGEITADEWQAVREALCGPVATERGPRLYYADLDTLLLANVDTEEGIWSVAADGLLRGGNDEVLVNLQDEAAARKEGLFPLWAVTDAESLDRWQAAMQHASNPERHRWAKFLRRVLNPLSRALAQD